MELPEVLAADRLNAIKVCLAQGSALSIDSLPSPTQSWGIDVSTIQIRVSTNVKDGKYFYIVVAVEHPLLEPQNCNFNIQRFGEEDGNRINIYHNGDNSTSARAGTYGAKNGDPLPLFAIAHYAPFKSNKYLDHELLGSIPRFGPISFADFQQHLWPGLGMHAIARLVYFANIP